MICPYDRRGRVVCVRMRGISFLASVLALASTLGGCLLLPSSGPNSLDVSAGASPSNTNYALVKLTPEVVKVLGEYGPLSISATFGDRRPPPEIRFGIGDVLSVTIFEAAAGGLFIPIEAGVRPGNFVELPNQPVDTHGNINVPYAGPVKAAGKTPSQVSADIVNRIKNRAIEPQALVALVNQNTSLITVVGEVNTSTTVVGTSVVNGRVPAMPAGERLLDYITRAGGLKDQGQDTWVTLERGGRRATVPFGALIYEHDNNIWGWPGDTIYLYKEPQTFLAFGASGQQGQFNFPTWKITLAEALGIAGGLLDVQSDPSAVYLYRREPRELAERLHIDCSRFEGPTVPIVYNVSFKDPGGYFLATKVQMHNKDVVFAANAQSVEVTKFFQLVNQMVATAEGVSGTGVNVETWRVLSHTR
jgi:polysaccharide biosynthesis/export protein